MDVSDNLRVTYYAHLNVSLVRDSEIYVYGGHNKACFYWIDIDVASVMAWLAVRSVVVVWYYAYNKNSWHDCNILKALVIYVVMDELCDNECI